MFYLMVNKSHCRLTILISGQPYESQGGELAVDSNPKEEQGVLSDAVLYLNILELDAM